MDKIYLGDAVYAEQDGYHIWPWTSDGITESAKIGLEPAVLDALFAYRAGLIDRVRIARAVALQDAADADAEETQNG